ncbi:Cytochrome c-type biogenesis protein CycH [Sulfitobacter noctilucicola]|uniref:Cytochrome c-type biogenesis protein CcmH n=1 Tax=Sulfitobacter noctilucicola TaxID=1342301 RepID=A0A7W6Q581_9RHOB|nr:c-type cytochrome biogenesis protein CcmI [Sulfitobacter noctilucicola]KIN64109.1 Cytochrome c-type biogenesis protein CycH [Sulfitobacter noctilucicola]MBB4175463.1 cytochrome c-type biogenesis protein CcmH [Sulfitobacter noctilucicola]
MTFWITTVLMAVLVASFLARALIGRGRAVAGDAGDYDLRVYRDQLAEIERDVARGVIPPEDAERVRTEISRRILAADAGRSAATIEPQKTPLLLVGALAITLIGGSIAIYTWLGQPGYGDLALQDRIAFAEELRENRPDQQTAVDSLPPFPVTEELSDEFVNLMASLRETVSARPDDLQGHILLAQNEARMGNFMDAAAAQNRVMQIKGEDVTSEDISDFGELLVLAAGGYVSPEAEVAFRAALNRDENDGRARYYLGLMMVQTGRPDIAFRLWNGLLRRGPADAAWIAPITAQIENVAQLAGVNNYSIPAIGGGAAPGPSVDDIEAASEMTAEARMEMIGGMVEGLSNRLATEGGPAQDWARLITSLGVLGDSEQALAIYNNAMDVFADDPASRDVIRAAGSQAGVAE